MEEKKKSKGVFAKLMYVTTCLMVSLSALINIVLLVFILPSYRGVFKSFGEIPAITGFFLGLSEFAGKSPVSTILFAAVLVWVVLYFIGKIKSDAAMIISSIIIGLLLVVQLLVLVVSMFIPIFNMNV